MISLFPIVNQIVLQYVDILHFIIRTFRKVSSFAKADSIFLATTPQAKQSAFSETRNDWQFE
jgi:hypothetical protein